MANHRSRPVAGKLETIAVDCQSRQGRPLLRSRRAHASRIPASSCEPTDPGWCSVADRACSQTRTGGVEGSKCAVQLWGRACERVCAWVWRDRLAAAPLRGARAGRAESSRQLRSCEAIDQAAPRTIYTGNGRDRIGQAAGAPRRRRWPRACGPSREIPGTGRPAHQRRS